MEKDCIFCKIVNKTAPAQIVYEDEKIIAFKDINPKAPIHIIVVSKKHIPSVNFLEEEDKELIAQMIFSVKEIARRFGEAKEGYKIVFNVEKKGGQMIPHLHLHFLAGKISQLP
jgi:histidine triad (HIT) family protein